MSNRIALVTGAAMGLGKSIAGRLARSGATIVAADRDAEALARVKRDGGFGDGAMTICVDISDSDDVAALFAAIDQHFGTLHIAANNAGITAAAPFLETERDMWDRQLAINATGTFLCTREAAKLMMPGGYGRIVNMSSHSSILGSSGRAAYAASKGAIDAFSRVAAVELADHGITVNTIAPGPVHTPHSQATHAPKRVTAWIQALPIARYGEAEEVAALTHFLVSEEAGYITGQTISIDGGFSIAGLRGG